MSVLFEDEVQVTFQVVNPVPGFVEPTREILLSPGNPTVVFGRCSSKNVDLEPAADNGYINSPIMSREHATLTLDPRSKAIFLEDQGSTHGTYFNGSAAPMHEAQEITKDDMVAFGITISRDGQEFPRCIMKITDITKGEKRRDDTVKTFGLIDIETSDEELDMEDIMDDDDDGREEIQETTMLELNDSVVQFTQDGGVSVDPDITLSTPHHDTTTDVAHPGSDVVLETVAKGTAVTIDLVEAEDSKEDAQATDMTTSPSDAAIKRTIDATKEIYEPPLYMEPATTRKIAPLPSRFTEKDNVKRLAEPRVVESILDPLALKRSHHDVSSSAGEEAEADDRTYKRIRKAAEVFGYMTLGGVATVAALIASAPAL